MRVAPKDLIFSASIFKYDFEFVCVCVWGGGGGGGEVGHYELFCIGKTRVCVQL